MTRSYVGNPCWYELTTSKRSLETAENFYTSVFDWTFQDAGMQGFDYHLAQHGSDVVAGMMQMPDDVRDMPPFWMIYFAVDDIDAFLIAARKSGASVHRGLDEVPGTGRFALLADPQGAAFGVMQPDMSKLSEAEMDKMDRGEGAFHSSLPGRCNWNELMSNDPDAAFDFYSRLFGWTRGAAIDMGKMGSYQLFQLAGTDIGGMMGLGDAPMPNWLPYFGVHGSVSATIALIKSTGGSIHHGPLEVPGGSFIAVGQDPQGAWFAVTGAEK